MPCPKEWKQTDLEVCVFIWSLYTADLVTLATFLHLRAFVHYMPPACGICDGAEEGREEGQGHEDHANGKPEL